jgi:CBS domain-containing protein
LWIAFIGWYLLSAAQQSVAGTVVRETLRRATVGQLMEPLPPIAPPHITIAQLLTQYLLAYNLRAVPVAQDGRLVGIVTLGDIQDVPQHEWGMVTVEQKMTGGDRLRTLRPQDDLGRAMTLLDDGHFDQLPVVDTAGKLVGILNRAHLLRWLKIRDDLLPPAPAK